MTPHSLPPSVLIADADPYICRVFEAKLTKEQPFRAFSVTTGQEAMQAAIQHDFAVILWDMRLRDTLRLLPHIRALCPDAVLLLLTTDDRPTLDSDFARLDVVDILVKPLNLDTLVERVRNALEFRRPLVPYSSLELARVGQSLEISSAAGACFTRVLENRQDSFVVVGAPRAPTPDDFAPGLRVHVRLSGKYALYSFASRLLKDESQPVSAWELQKPRLIRREQRRRSPRLPVHLPISLEPLESEPGSDFAQAVVGAAPDTVNADASFSIQGQTEDIGKGGLALLAEREVPAGTPVRFTIDAESLASELSERPPLGIEGSGTIARVQPYPPGDSLASGSGYLLAIQFSSLSSSARRQLRALLDSSVS